MPLKLNGATSGYVQLDAPSVAGTTAITVPAISGTLIVADSNGNVGIGTSASYKLQVTGGSIYQSQSDASMSRIGLSNTNRHWTISNYGTSYGPNGSFNIADETAASVRFQIDTSGRVSMPFQPCFYAYSGSANPTLSGTAQALVFTTAATNIGSNYSTSNGRFTAPVAGNYIFHWHFVQTGALTGPLVYLYKNGANVSTAAIAYGTSYNNAAASAIITLAASDYVQLYGISFNSTSPVIDMNYSGFSGHLVG